MAQVGVLTSRFTRESGKASVVNTIEVPTPPKSPEILVPRTISELISFRARLAHDQPILGYPSHGTEYVEYTFGQLHRYATVGANQLALSLPIRSTSSEKESVVALLGPSTLDYFVTALSLSRLGFTVLFLSTRLSEAAYISLLKATNCRNICTDQGFRKTVDSVQNHIPDLMIRGVLSANDYDKGEEYMLDVEQQHNQRLKPDDETNKIAWIIHSSGSTGLPKPIYQTHSAALRNYEHNMNMEGFITLPLFHAHGLSSVLRGFSSYKKIFMYSASIPLTSQNLLDIARKHSFEIFYGVPYALKLLSESEEGIQMLTHMKVVMFGGSACPDGLGDLLVDRGVNLISHYGTTETGQLMTSFRPTGDKAWNYVRVHERLKPFVRFEERGGNMFELVVLDGWPSKVATNRDDGSYATKDLFEPHPSLSGAWKYSGRLDDTIILMNGEKAIPLAMEMAVRQQTLVKDAVVFGTGKTRLGMAIIASDAASSQSSDEFIENLWPIIEAENINSPAYGQLSRETLLVLPAGSAYPQTDKGTLIRQAFYKTFAKQIDDVYQRLEASSTGTLVLSEEQLRTYLRRQILRLCPGLATEAIEDEADLFSLGIDSLQSSRLRGSILHDIRLNGQPISQNIVFEHPSIVKLAAAIVAARDGTVAVTDDVEIEMERLISKYDQFPSHVPIQAESGHRIVVVTGVTGSLGAHIVAQLAARNDVSEVCCLVRAATKKIAEQRTFKSMNERAVLHSLPLRARRKITAYPSDLAKSNLGLTEAIYQHLARGITSLIHCAWSVNFNKRLSSFEADCIAGAHNLILLCLASKRPQPASFNFCSSVSTVARTPGLYVPEALPESLACAQGMGYAQSKMVTEHIVARAVRQTGMAARVLRIGQIVADTVHGIWNDTEAIPLMLQAAVSIGALPVLNEKPRWLPVDKVATCVNDISLSRQTNSFFNIVNPNAFHWTDDLLPKLDRSGLAFKRVDQRRWIQMLRESDTNVVTNPTFKLLDFFASKYEHDRPATSGLTYETTAVEMISPAIRTCEALPQDLVDKFIKTFLATSWAAKSTASNGHKSMTTLVVLSGPCGSGKSSVASTLSHTLSQDAPSTALSIEGDTLHDAVALTKMSNGVPLSSLDREIWLARLKIAVMERIRSTIAMGANMPRYIILTCSALRRSHRQALRSMLGDVVDDDDDNRVIVKTQFVMLEASEDELIRRVQGRKGHYMKSDMVRSQLDVLEPPSEAERDVLPVDTEGKDGVGAAAEICAILGFL